MANLDKTAEVSEVPGRVDDVEYQHEEADLARIEAVYKYFGPSSNILAFY